MVLTESPSMEFAQLSLLAHLCAPDGHRAAVVITSLSLDWGRIQTHEYPSEVRGCCLELTLWNRFYCLAVMGLVGIEEGGFGEWHCRLGGKNDLGLRRLLHMLSEDFRTQERTWEEVRRDAFASPGAPVLVGRSPRGHGIHISATDVLELAPSALDLLFQTLCEVEEDVNQ
jgi:hypothetical protein